jgi:hypothetical protein
MEEGALENYWGAIFYSFLAVWRVGDAFVLKASFFIGLLRMCFFVLIGCHGCSAFISFQGL